MSSQPVVQDSDFDWLNEISEEGDLKAPWPDEPPESRKIFKDFSQTSDEPKEFLIDGFLPTGVTVISAYSGVGKTWTGLSLAKALINGKSWFGHNIPKQRNVLYLNAEVDEASFRSRMVLFNCKDKRFMFQTLTDKICGLSDASLLEMCAVYKPVVFLDTVRRFMDGDENDATAVNRVAKQMFALITAGAAGIVAKHHVGKRATGRVTLEDVRGSGDFIAMSDAVIGISRNRDDAKILELYTLKGRDFGNEETLQLTCRYGYDEDFYQMNGPVKSATVEGKKDRTRAEQVKAVGDFIRDNKNATVAIVSERTKVHTKNIILFAELAGWHKPHKKAKWERKDSPSDSLRDFEGPLQ